MSKNNRESEMKALFNRCIVAALIGVTFIWIAGTALISAPPNVAGLMWPTVGLSFGLGLYVAIFKWIRAILPLSLIFLVGTLSGLGALLLGIDLVLQSFRGFEHTVQFLVFEAICFVVLGIWFALAVPMVVLTDRNKTSQLISERHRHEFVFGIKVAAWSLAVAVAILFAANAVERFLAIKIASVENMSVPIAELLIGLIVLVGALWRFRYKSGSVNVIILGLLAIFLSAGMAHLMVNLDHLPVQYWLPESLVLFAGTTTASFLLHAVSPRAPLKPKNNLGSKR